MPGERSKSETGEHTAPAEENAGRRKDEFTRTQGLPVMPVVQMGAGDSGQSQTAPKLIPEEEADYEALFLKDAQQRAHDAELAALASLALIRSNRGEHNQMLFSLERGMNLSPRMVDRHLREIDRDAAAALLSDPEDRGGRK